MKLPGKIFAFLFLIFAASGAASDRAITASAPSAILSPQVVITQARPDCIYQPGEPVTFLVRVLANGFPIPADSVLCSVGPERFEKSLGKKSIPAEGLRIEGGTLTEPGFLRCKAEAIIEGVSYSADCTVGFAPEAIRPTQVEPPDFDAFWTARLAELAKIPARPAVTLMPEACTPEVNVFSVSYDSWGIGPDADRFYGVLTVPAKTGRYPAVLKLPGAGVRPYAGDLELAALGVIVFEIGIHGIPVDLPQPLYENLYRGALQNYAGYGLDSRDTYFFLRIYLACVQANEVLIGQPAWDGKNLVAAGGSQGGHLSIVTSALDPRVTATVANYPGYCDVTGYLHHRAGGWPHLLAKPEHQTEAKISASAYYDTVNFARRLRAPGSYGWGFNDLACPPTSTFAAYNVITAPKELWLQPEMPHRSSPEFNTRYRERILRFAGSVK